VIKVNLLTTTPTLAEPKRAWIPPGQRSAVLGLVLLFGTAAGVGGYWWYLRGQGADVETRIRDREAQLAQLKQAAALVEQANARKAELGERLSLIERLRGSKRGPVVLLETVSRSVPEGLWLIEFRQTGLTVQIEGRALSLTSVTDFAERLQTSGLFRHPVEILTTTTEIVEETPVIRFAVRAESTNEFPAQGETPAGGAAPADPGPANAALIVPAPAAGSSE
jgi:Tfp pilus assembly protein PilN